MGAGLSNHWQVSDDDLTADEDFADNVAGFESYDGLDFQYQVQQVADRIYDIHQERGVRGEFIFGLECNADREISSATVAVPCTNQVSIYLMVNLDTKRLTDDRAATGWNQAAAIRDALMRAYAEVRALAITKELI